MGTMSIISTRLQSFFLTSALLSSSVLAGEGASNITIDKSNPTAQAFGLTVEYVSILEDSSKIELKVSCLKAEETPKLALDAEEFGSTARLSNATRESESGCLAYEINLLSIENVLGSQDWVLESLVVGIPPDPARSSAQDTETSAIFAFNPVHGY